MQTVASCRFLFLVRKKWRKQHLSAAKREQIRYHSSNAKGSDQRMAWTGCGSNNNSGANVPMAKEPRATDSTTPKKRTRKPATEAENGTKVVSVMKTAKPKQTNDVVAALSIEEQIRARAYELYLQRGGQGGSPEQDWFRAAEEIYGQSVA